MKFRRGSASNLVSECGRYSVAKVIIDSAVTYEAWHIPEKPAQPFQIEVRIPTSLEAIGACRRHAEQHQERASA